MTDNQFKDNGKFSYFQLTRAHMYLNTVRQSTEDVASWTRGLTPDGFERANLDEARDAAEAIRDAAERLVTELDALKLQAEDIPVMPGAYLGLMEQAARKAASARMEVMAANADMAADQIADLLFPEETGPICPSCGYAKTEFFGCEKCLPKGENSETGPIYTMEATA